jgi:hypothetical protein
MLATADIDQQCAEQDDKQHDGEKDEAKRFHNCLPVFEPNHPTGMKLGAFKLSDNKKFPVGQERFI